MESWLSPTIITKTPQKEEGCATLFNIVEPILQFQQQRHLHQMKAQIEEEQKKTLQLVETLQQLVPAMQKQHLTQLQNLQEIKQHREQHLLYVQKEEQRRHQEEMNELQGKFYTVNLQLQLLQLEKQIEKNHHLSKRIEEKHRYPTKEEAKYDEKVSDSEDGRNVCVICLENRRLCLVRPCKHFSLCVACSTIELEDCPECRAKITCIERLYI